MKLNVGFDLKYAEGDIVSSEIKIPPPKIVTTDSLKKMLKDKNFGKEKKIYKIYQNVFFPGDDKLFRRYRLRFDIIIMQSGKLGHEFVKTEGHYIDRSEIYEVISGEGVFMLHKGGGFYPLVCDKGERAEIPKRGGVIVSNQSQATLIYCRLVPDKIEEDKSKFERNQGGAFFLLSRNKFVKNGRWKSRQRRATPKKSKETLYNEFVSHPERFKYLREK